MIIKGVESWSQALALWSFIFFVFLDADRTPGASAASRCDRAGGVAMTRAVLFDSNMCSPL